MQLKPNNISLILFAFLCAGCEPQATNPIAQSENQDKPIMPEITGLWRGVLASPGGELPFGIDISQQNGQYSAKILNGEERVDTSSVLLHQQHISIYFEWYDAKIEAQISDDGHSMTGLWQKTASGVEQTSQLPFTASKGYEYRFSQERNNSTIEQIKPQWQVTFTDTDGESVAVAELQQSKHIVTGTFLTPTGDYRFLAGTIKDNRLYLSAFDGAHAFLFDAKINNDNITDGNFWSRDSYHATWVAQAVDDSTDFLPSAWDMNQVTSTDKTIAFAFEDIQGNTVQLSDQRFNNKPVLINIFGTWCPNCNDEAPVLAQFYDQYQSQGLEIVGLAFEFTNDAVRDKRQLAAFEKRHKINYPLLLAGTDDKAEATKVLGFLDEVKSYPTTLFLDKNHRVTKIYTGFSGPGTGQHYTELVAELETEIKKLLLE